MFLLYFFNYHQVTNLINHSQNLGGGFHLNGLVQLSDTKRL